ncbi:fructose-1,6-bisphosphatase/inositol monophosphatase family enzyme [Neorhizobium huautlense]|uniref:Fructose-1,6-bisphosphatase/inositol monophosphatase family enzyme n=1 Tax=Neorhizobium huautlense TaxID=67774 RepID=A0ABT9PM90_9HYPH|nr:inositol monophosphatase [Neorhizobium huautlense]MDP9835278.1 fructose-1,6-bisphosphatase/inositol monophosphatase family enzyme [Neorhizobium huautlense]
MKTVSDELLDELMGIMREASAGEILPRFRSVTSDSIRAKTAADDIVTDADIASERLISERLKARLPGITIIGEEAVSEDASILAKLADADLAAVIDPVDGTWHFAHGTPMFGSILAIVSGGKTIAGIIHYPVLGDFLVARPGLGAWHVATDGARTRLSVAAPGPVNEMHGFIPLHMFEPGRRAELAPRVLKFLRVTTWRCSAWEYRMLATGAMSFCLNDSLKPWDHAAGVLIHAEAGGYAATMAGEVYRPTMTQGHLLTAPDKLSWQAIVEALTED